MLRTREVACGTSSREGPATGRTDNMAISPEAQVQFLLKIQRLLGEGLFTATYKFALLMALADLSVELGDDSGAALEIDVDRIAGKFIEYYWRQTLPYVGR